MPEVVATGLGNNMGDACDKPLESGGEMLLRRRIAELEQANAQLQERAAALEREREDLHRQYASGTGSPAGRIGDAKSRPVAPGSPAHHLDGEHMLQALLGRDHGIRPSDGPRWNAVGRE